MRGEVGSSGTGGGGGGAGGGGGGQGAGSGAASALGPPPGFSGPPQNANFMYNLVAAANTNPMMNFAAMPLISTVLTLLPKPDHLCFVVS